MDKASQFLQDLKTMRLFIIYVWYIIKKTKAKSASA